MCLFRLMYITQNQAKQYRLRIWQLYFIEAKRKL